MFITAHLIFSNCASISYSRCIASRSSAVESFLVEVLLVEASFESVSFFFAAASATNLSKASFAALSAAASEVCWRNLFLLRHSPSTYSYQDVSSFRFRFGAVSVDAAGGAALAFCSANSFAYVSFPIMYYGNIVSLSYFKILLS